MPEDAAPRPDEFADALRALAASRATGNAPIDCRVPSPLAAPLPRETASAIHRICDEALVNAVRHAGARRITVEVISREDRILVRILDDGDGLDLEALHGSGMLRMDELARAANGRLEVRSAPRAGTCVSATFPLAK